MSESAYLANQFLIAMPGMEDPNFSHGVTYLCEHNEHGAMGILVNRPADISLAQLLEHMDIKAGDPAARATRVFVGGPVQPERGFVLHRPQREWATTVQITDEVSLTTSRDILESMAAGDGPDNAIVALGYAGWGAGQLEEELRQNAWLSTQALASILFDTPIAERWTQAARSMGVDPTMLSDYAGHA